MARNSLRNWLRPRNLDNRRTLKVSRLEDRTVPADISGSIYEDWAANDALNNNDPGLEGQTAYIDVNNNGVNDTLSFTAADTPVAIPDLVGGVPGIATSSVTVSGVTGNVTDVNVRVNITHTFDQDLILTLISPGGTRVILSNRRGGSGDNFINTVFDDQGITAIGSGAAPFTGSFIPEEALGNVAGGSSDGVWTLEVTDNAGIDVGTIDTFNVTFTTDLAAPEPTATTDANGLYTFTGLAAGTYNIRSVLDAGQTATGPAVYNVVLGASNVTGRDFGRIDQNAIYGTAFGDTNNNGVLDGGETRSAGVTAFIDEDSDSQLDFQDLPFTATDTPVTIPDFAAGVVGLASSSLTVSGFNEALDKVTVTVNITHTFDLDLILTLISPNGTRVILSNRRGGSGDNFTSTVFDDAAATAIGAAANLPPYTGSFRPDEPLSVLNGLSGADVNGTWMLEVTDNAAVDVGTIDGFTIQLTGGEVNTVTDALGDYKFSNLAPATYSVRAVAPAGLTQTLPAANGAYSVVLAAGGTSNNKDFGFGTGGGVAPTVTGTSVNGAAAQRSRVTTLDVTFSAQVSFAGAVANAFTLTLNGGGAIGGFTATANVVGGVTVVTLNGFTGAGTSLGSLNDGNYTLTALANQINVGGTNMAANYTFGSVPTDRMFRFYGDVTGDRRVDIADFGSFSAGYLQGPGANVPSLDFNQDGRLDITDFGQFSLRYFTTLP